MIKYALLMSGALLVSCSDAPCDTGDRCTCSFDSDCPDPLVEFCDRRVFACALRPEPLTPDVSETDAGADAETDVQQDEDCGNEVDDDGDGLVDCADPFCFLVCAPAARTIAFVQSAGLPRIATVDASGGEPVVIAGGAATNLATDPTYSAAGAIAIVYADESFEGLHVISESGEVLQRVPNAEGVSLVRQPSWTRAGGLLAAATVEERRVLLEVSLDTGETVERYREADAQRYVSAPIELLDGQLVLIAGESSGGFGGGTGDLAFLVDGALELATEGLGLSGRLTPDGRGGLYAYSTTAGQSVYVVPVRGEVRSLADVQRVGQAGDADCVPLDEDVFVCSRSVEQSTGVQVSDLAVVERDGTLLEWLTTTPNSSEGSVTVSPSLAADASRP